MTRLLYAVLAVLLAALCVYFFGTPWLARASGLAPRTISLLAGLAVVISAVVAMMLGRIAAQGRASKPDIDSRR